MISPQVRDRGAGGGFILKKMATHRYTLLFSLVLASLFSTSAAAAGFTENFTSGVDFTVNDQYWLDYSTIASQLGPIGSGVGGTGNFLFNSTWYYDTNTQTTTIPAGQDQFFIGSSFSVTPNTDYTVSFYLTNADSINLAQIQPDMNGTTLGAASVATGYWATDGWQLFTYSWNSGNHSTATLTLHDLQQTTVGNDFGIANISVSAVGTETPEPGTFGLISAVGIGCFSMWKRRRARVSLTSAQ